MKNLKKLKRKIQISIYQFFADFYFTQLEASLEIEKMFGRSAFDFWMIRAINLDETAKLKGIYLK